MTTRKRLMKLAAIKWGGRWRRELATASDRDRRTVYRWCSGATPVPAWVWALVE